MTGTPVRPKIIQIAVASPDANDQHDQYAEIVYALRDDGSIWYYQWGRSTAWTRMPEIGDD